MKLVCIIGIDGAGKSTLARKTATALRKCGQPAVCIYGRPYPVLSRFLMAAGRYTLLRHADPWKDYPTYVVSKKQTMRHPLLAAIYTVAVLLDYFAQIWFTVLPHLASRRLIVADRYFYDTVIGDLAVHLNYSVADMERTLRWGLRFLPRPQLVILIDLPEEVAFARKSDMPHIDYLRERRPWYLRLCSRPEVILFDGEVTEESLVRSFIREITAWEHLTLGD